MDISKTYLEKQFMREAAVYAMEAGQESASKLNAAIQSGLDDGALRKLCIADDPHKKPTRRFAE